MKTTTTAVLSVLALGLLAYIYFYERNAVSSGDLEFRSSRLMPALVRSKLERVEIQQAAGNVVLARMSKEGAPDAWNVVSPKAGPADAETVDALLAGLEWAESRRTLRGLSEADFAKFGLSKPTVTVKLTVAGAALTLRIGSEDPKGQGFYAATDEAGTAHVVGKDLVEALRVGEAELRDKNVLRGVDAEAATRVTVRAPEDARETTLEKRDGAWFAKGAFEGYANRSRVDEVLAQALTFRATRYVDDAPADLAKYGLDRPSALLEVGGGSARVRVVLGGACEGHDGEVYLRVDAGPVLCAGARDAAGLTMQADLLREDRLVTVDEREFEGLRIEADGKMLTLARAGGGFELSDGAGKVPADFDSVMAFVRALRFPRAVTFGGEKDGAPIATLTVHRHEQPDEVAALLEERDGVAWVRRGAERTATQFVGDLRGLFTPSRTRFLSRRMIDDRGVDAVRLSRAGAGTKEEAVHEGGAWRMRGVDALDLSGSEIALAADSVARLTAVRFVADAPMPHHGLDAPALIVEAAFESRGATGRGLPTELGGGDDAPAPPSAAAPGKKARPRSYVIRFGRAAGDEGVFARVNEGPVGIVERAAAERLLRPWRRGGTPLDVRFVSGAADGTETPAGSEATAGASKGDGAVSDPKRRRKKRVRGRRR